MQCPQCGHEEEEQHRFCTQCGASLKGEAKIVSRPVSPVIALILGTGLGPWLAVVSTLVLQRRWGVRKHRVPPLVILLLNLLFLAYMVLTNHAGLWLGENASAWALFHLLLNPITLLFNFLASFLLFRLFQPLYHQREWMWQSQIAAQAGRQQSNGEVDDPDGFLALKDQLLFQPAIWSIGLLMFNSLLVEALYQFGGMKGWLEGPSILLAYAGGSLAMVAGLFSAYSRLEQRFWVAASELDPLRGAGVIQGDEQIVAVHLADPELRRGILCTTEGFRYWNLENDPPYRQISWVEIEHFQIRRRLFSKVNQLHIQLQGGQQILWQVRGYEPYFSSRFIVHWMKRYQEAYKEKETVALSKMDHSTLEGVSLETESDVFTTSAATNREQSTLFPILGLVLMLLVVVGGESFLYWTLATKGEQAYAAGDFQTASQYYHWASRLDPFQKMGERATESDYQHWMKVGDEALQQRKYDDAITAFAEAQKLLNTREIRAKQVDAEYRQLIALGEKYSLKEEYGRAIQHFKKAQKLKNSDEVRKKIAQVEYMYHYMKAQELLYYDPFAALEELELAAEVIATSDVETLMEEAIMLIVDDLLYLAEEFLYYGDVENATDILLEAKRFAPDDERIEVMLAAIEEGIALQDVLAQNPLLILPNWEWYIDDGYVYAVGTILNRSEELVENIVVGIEYYDENEQLVLRDQAHADGPAEAGKTTAFTIFSVYQERMTTAKVEILEYEWATEVEVFPH